MFRKKYLAELSRVSVRRMPVGSKARALILCGGVLLGSHAKIYGVLDLQSIVPMIEQHLAGEQNRRLLIWSLLNVEAWMKENSIEGIK
jgi:hypothetical protein